MAKHHKFGRTSLRRLGNVRALTMKVARAGLANSPYDLGIPDGGGFRTAEEQNELHLNGASPNLDGYIKKSYHQSGFAFDFYLYIDSAASWDREKMAIAACAILEAAHTLDLTDENGVEYVVEWGGLWTNPCDMPHIQLVPKK
jgi:hypothetical protein